jgi:hypothetical protein
LHSYNYKRSAGKVEVSWFKGAILLATRVTAEQGPMRSLLL